MCRDEGPALAGYDLLPAVQYTGVNEMLSSFDTKLTLGMSRERADCGERAHEQAFPGA